MMKRLYLSQTLILAAGVLFSWYTVVVDFLRFYGMEGTIFKVKDCFYPNPVTTACFYGAIAFLVAFIWSIYILRTEDRAKKEFHETRLSWLLSAATIFAWANFGNVLYKFYGENSNIGCSGVPISSPFLTPCFYGSVIFLISLVVALIIIKKNPAPPGPAA